MLPSVVSNFPAQLKTLFNNLSILQKIIILTVIGCVVFGLIFLIVWTGRSDYQLLYANLPAEDAGAVAAKLKEQNIAYKIDSAGSSISVPKEKLHEIRMNLASQGLPHGGDVGFEIFDDTKLGMTEFVQNVNYQRALQGELSRTIDTLKEVESSRVHIVMPVRSVFVEKEEPATASVVLKLRPFKKLNKQQIDGIVHLVSSSVSSLSPESVTILDSHGKMLAGFDDELDESGINNEQLIFQEKIERNLENRVKTMLESVLGKGKAIVRISCDLNFKRYEQTEELYNPKSKVIRSEQLLNESSGGAGIVPAGVPGVIANTNVSIGNEGDQNSGNIRFKKNDQTVNYEVSKVMSRTVEPVGEIARISVAVIVDGTYKQVDAAGGAKQWKYVARTDEEMEKFTSLVKRAVNFDAERGDEIEVASISFETVDRPDLTQQTLLAKFQQYPPLIKYGVPILFLLFCFFFIVRPLMKRITSGREEKEMIKQLPKTVEEIESEYGDETKQIESAAPEAISNQFRKRLLETVEKDPKNAANLMKEWLSRH